MNFLNYLLQTNLYLLLFMGFYWLVLRNETFFRQNRIFLNASVVLSFLIPFMNTDWFRDLVITQQVRESAVISGQRMFEMIVIVDTAKNSGLNVTDLIGYIYIAITLLLLIRLIFQLASIRTSLQLSEGKAFSFFNTLVVDPLLENAETIKNHERVHIRQWHSADILLIEVAGAINWFNPVMYLYKKEIRHIHEFIADEEAASLMKSKSDYATLLFTNTLGVHPSILANNFFNTSLLKRRITMLNKTRSGRTALWKYGFTAPLFAIMLVVSAAVASAEDNALSLNSSQTFHSIEKITANLSAPPEITLNENPASTHDSAAYSSPISKVETTNSVNKKLDRLPAQATDYSELKRHLQKTLKYPAEARDANQVGFSILTFSTANRKITGAKVKAGMAKLFDEEGLRAINSFEGAINVPDGEHTIGLFFKLLSSEQTVVSSPSITPMSNQPNYAGEVTVFSLGNARVTAGSIMTADGGKLPEFYGGMEGWANYLKQNLSYPKAARDSNITGRVIISMIVEKDGSLADVKVLRGIGGGCDEEAVRVIKSSPKWIPGTDKYGQPVKVAYTLPISFATSSRKP